MKKKLLLLLTCLFGALGGVKAWTNQSPSAGNTYYLYHPGLDQFLFVGLDEKYGVTPSVFNATPIYVETGGSGDGNTTFSFVIRGTKYYLYQNGGIGSLRTDYGSQFEPKRSEGLGKYRLQTEKGSRGGRTTYKMLHAGTSGGQCSFEEYESRSESDGYEWQFISESDVESARNTMAESCALSAASYATTSNGWERVTSISDLQTNPENYFFAIFSANAAGLMLQATSNNAESQRLYYKTATDPANSSQYLFEIENHVSGGFALKSCAIGKYFSNTSGAPYFFHANQTSATSDNNTKLTLSYVNGAYTIETAQATNYVGLWTLITNWYSTDKDLAGNKQSSLAGSFLIYRIPKQRLRNVDFTQCITNPSFETSNTNGWTVLDGGTPNETGAKQTSSYAMSGSDGDWLFNIYWQGKPMTQNIGVLPAGQYTLSAVTTTDQGAKTYLTVNSGHNDGATSTGGASVGVTNTYNFTLAETTEVTIGVVGCGNNAEKTFDPNGYYWYKADNFRLTYLEGLHDLTPVSGKMKASVEEAQTAAVNAYNSNKTVENYFAAKAAIANAEASVAAYANALTYLEKVEEVLATTNFYTTAAYDNVYGNYKTAYDDNTLDDATAAGLSYKVATHEGTQRYDANTANNLLIPGWTIGGNDAKSSGSGFYVNTWSNEGNTDGSNVTTPFYEYWTADGNALAAKDLVANISGYKENTLYRVSALVRVRQQNTHEKADDDLTFKVGSGAAVNAADGTQSSSMYYKTVIATGSSDAEGNLSVTFSVKDGNHISWVAFKNITVEELADDREVNLLFNADFEEPYTVYASSGVSSDRAIYVPNGWTINGTFNENDMTIFNSGDKASDNFSGITELPRGGNNTFLYRGKWGDNTDFKVYQKITLPAGTYRLSCDAWKSGLGGNGEIFAGTETATLPSNEASWRPLPLEFTLNEETTLNVGFRVTHTSNNNEKFIGFDNFGLYTVNKVDEGVTYTPVDKAAHIVIVRRTIKEGVNTVVFPFSMTQEEVEAYFGAGSVVYQLSSYDNGTIHFTTKEGLSANKPCLVKATSTAHSATDYELADRTLVSGTPESVGENVTMVGTYDAVTTIAQGNYIVKDDMLYVVDSDNVKMRNTRAYITLSTNPGARLAISFDGENPTAINAIETEDAEDGALKDGKYLIDGKIVIVKNGVKYGANGQKLN